MKILILGAGVVGTTYGWQLSIAGHDVTLFVRPGRRVSLEQDGVRIRCRDDRKKPAVATEHLYRPQLTDHLRADDNYELIMVCVRAQQLDAALSVVKSGAVDADILFFGNNWWGDEKIRRVLAPGRYLFGFSRLVAGSRHGHDIDCVIFNNPSLMTMLGERTGEVTPRLQRLMVDFQAADLRPRLSRDILGWLAIHYVEFLGVVGGILRAGSTEAFTRNSHTVRQAILATREALQVCRARGISLSGLPLNLRLVNRLPLSLLAALIQQQYRTPTIQQFFEENLASGNEELPAQYDDVLSEARRLAVATPVLESFEAEFKAYRSGAVLPRRNWHS